MISISNRQRRMLVLIAALFLTTVHSGLGRPVSDAGAPADTLSSFVNRLRFDSPRQHGAMTIVPLCGVGRTSPVMTLSEALRGGTLMIHEIGEGRVNELEVENTGKSPVFTMAGQILVGAKQNRVLQHDLLLPPLSGKLTVEAYCVQHDRWTHGKELIFSKSENVSNVQVRQAATVARAQSAVWKSVDSTRAGAGVRAETDARDLNAVYEAAPVRASLKGYASAFGDLPLTVPDMQGAVVLLDGRIVAVDVFGDRVLLRHLWRPLLASYALDGARRDRMEVGGCNETARSFLRQAVESEMRRVPTAGSGALLELSGPQIRGDALIVSHSVLHLDLFPAGRATKSDVDGDEPPIFRRR